MAPNPKVVKACKAMKPYGIPEETVKSALKNLLNVYDKKWSYIEDENYRVLLDAIFDSQDHKIQRKELKKQEFRSRDDPEDRSSLIKQNGAESEVKTVPALEVSQGKGKKPSSSQTSLVSRQSKPSQDFSPESPQRHLKAHGEESELPKVFKRKRRPTCETGTSRVPSSKQAAIPTDACSPKDKAASNELPQFEVPLAIIHPDDWSRLNEYDSSNRNHLTGEEDGSKFPEIICLDEEDKSPPRELCDHGPSDERVSSCEGNSLVVLESQQLDTEDKEDDSPVSSQIDIASSPKGEVKLSFICNHPQLSNFHIPSLNAVLKRVEDKYNEAFRINDTGFSLSNLLKEMCECLLEESTVSMDKEQVHAINVPATNDIVKNPNKEGVPLIVSNGSGANQNLTDCLPQIPRFSVSTGLDFLHSVVGLNFDGNDFVGSFRKKQTFDIDGPSNSSSLAIVPMYHSFELSNNPCLLVDITRGTENHGISLINEFNNEKQPAFTYIPRNVPYKTAYVKFILARISDDNCCSNCLGNCLSLEIPCACAGETGGEFAYTPEGLIRERFLENCLSIILKPQKHNYFYCENCPLERSKDTNQSGSCKGHLVRKFIKECWYKCGCGLNCGNRVVQRGITANLQIFMTPDGKGWGLRTLEDLPKGAFICEYVGEIVTNTELFQRNMQNANEKHTYPVLLDADWSSEGFLRDEEALCLDATCFGNVARFINHRCFDANMVEIPVEVESPDHHYYHHAFFTTREVKALEELTWDYGIDFDDASHPIKAFQCHCGSKFCRNLKRKKRARCSP